MANALGVSFIPGGPYQQRQQGQPDGPGGGAGIQPLQRAIQMLSVRLPQMKGATGLAPGALLNAPGVRGMPVAGLGGGSADNPILQAMMRLAGMRASGGGALGASQGAPPFGPQAPRIIPGALESRRGPGVSTQPAQDFSQFIDRRNPGAGNRWGGAPLNRPQMPGIVPGMQGSQRSTTGYLGGWAPPLNRPQAPAPAQPGFSLPPRYYQPSVNPLSPFGG